MKLVDEAGTVFTGELVERKSEEEGYSYHVLRLTSELGKVTITLEKESPFRFCLIEATLNERSRLDGTGFYLPVNLSYQQKRRRPVQ